MSDEIRFPNERYEDYSNEQLFMEIIHMVCEMRARYDVQDELKDYLTQTFSSEQVQ